MANIFRFVVSVMDVGLWRNDRLASFFDGPVSVALPFLRTEDARHLGWGRKPSGRRAVRRALRFGQEFCLLEDGFLRSVGLAWQEPSLSLVVDDLGIYYDAARPSRLEQLIAEGGSSELLDEARQAMALVRRHRLSKYNHAPEVLPQSLSDMSSSDTPKVLVIDQPADSLSVRFGGATPAVFSAMLAAALAENPTATIFVKPHPDVLAGKRRGCLGVPAGPPGRVVYLAEEVNPLALLEAMDKVYAVTSQMGFEALLAGKPVVCFGLPWYAGWGLTDDRHPEITAVRVRRPAPRSLEQLFAAAYLRYARYLNPETRGCGSLFDVIRHLAALKRFNDETRGTLFFVGRSLWRRAVVPTFLRMPSNRLRFISSVDDLKRDELPKDARLVAWSRGKDAELTELAQWRGIPVLRMEDGFLRSVGLGSDSRRPLSLVVDDAGIYFDPRHASALERWLETGQPDVGELLRARQLRDRLVRLGLSKYNVGGAFTLNAQAIGRRVLLVPGQVEDDASVRFGSPDIHSNLGLLEAVRTANPDAFVIYKPHPDVIGADRLGVVDEARLSVLCDQVAVNVDIIECIRLADEVHTMTSQAGFESLLHGKTVFCYGLPFYAGWGLTQDRLSSHRRTRRLTLDELVYGALIHYPRYVDPHTLKFISAERAVCLLEQARQSKMGEATRSSLLVRDWRKFWEWVRLLVWH